MNTVTVTVVMVTFHLLSLHQGVRRLLRLDQLGRSAAQSIAAALVLVHIVAAKIKAEGFSDYRRPGALLSHKTNYLRFERNFAASLPKFGQETPDCSSEGTYCPSGRRILNWATDTCVYVCVCVCVCVCVVQLSATGRLRSWPAALQHLTVSHTPR